MTKLRAHYDAKLKAFVPDEAGDWPDGTQVDVELADDATAADEGRDLPPFPGDAGVFFTGGPGLTLAELARRVEELDEPLFADEDVDSVELVRRWRDQPR